MRILATLTEAGDSEEEPWKQPGFPTQVRLSGFLNSLSYVRVLVLLFLSSLPLLLFEFVLHTSEKVYGDG